MQIPTRTRFIGDEDVLAIWWTIGGELIDFSGMSFVAKVAPISDSTAVVFTKTTGFIGTVGSGNEQSGTPNLEVEWASTGELNSLTAGTYLLQIVATSVDGAESTFQMQLNMLARLG